MELAALEDRMMSAKVVWVAMGLMGLVWLAGAVQEWLPGTPKLRLSVARGRHASRASAFAVRRITRQEEGGAVAPRAQGVVRGDGTHGTNGTDGTGGRPVSDHASRGSCELRAAGCEPGGKSRKSVQQATTRGLLFSRVTRHASGRRGRRVGRRRLEGARAPFGEHRSRRKWGERAGGPLFFLKKGEARVPVGLMARAGACGEVGPAGMSDVLAGERGVAG